MGVSSDKPQWRLPTDDMPDGWYWCEGRDYPIKIKFVRRAGLVAGTRCLERDGDSWVWFDGLVAPCTGRPE